MAGGAILECLEPVKACLFDVIRKYVGYIGSCKDNLRILRKNLNDVCDKKDDIDKKVKDGEDKLEDITREAASWLKDVRLLVEEQELNRIMFEDIEIAKVVVKLMGKKELKKRVRKDREMQNKVVEVMSNLKNEMEGCEAEMRRIVEVDYKAVAEVVVEVMKDLTEEFKNLMKKDNKMAVMATKRLKDSDLERLTKDDKELEKIVREAGSLSDEELWQYHVDEDEENSNSVIKKVPEVAVYKNSREAARNLFTLRENLLTPLRKLMDDSTFKNLVPEAENVKLVLDIVDELFLRTGWSKKRVGENTRRHRSYCCRAVAVSCYHNRYKISIAAETMANRIEKDLIKKCPGNPVTVRKRSADMKPTPSQFVKGLQSRDKLLQDIQKILRDDQVNAVGVFGMGGSGKSTLAKEVANKRADDTFGYKVIVEISESPDIKRIQERIAESIDLKLKNDQSLTQRAVMLYNRLNSDKGKKILIILDNIWKKLNLNDVGIPDTCKLLLTTRNKDVCQHMGVRDAHTFEISSLDANEAKGLFKTQVGDIVDNEKYTSVTDRLLSKCGGLPLAITVTASALKNKDLPHWLKFADEAEKPISCQSVNNEHYKTYSILATSYKFLESKGKRMFFLLCCLCPLGLPIPIKEILRYGIGLDLFQHVNKLSEAMDQAGRWADELLSSSMLLKSDLPGHFKIHDVVRAFGILIAAKDDKHKLLVDVIPRWMNKKTLRDYTAISLLSGGDYSCLNRMESDKLQILLLSGSLLPDIPKSFFGGMRNLEVLDLTSMNFQPRLPDSIGELVMLRTLYLEACKLGDIKVIGELVNLSVLCLRDSYLEELPDELGKLCNLRLLDLTGCKGMLRPVPSKLLGRLAELEGLYMFDSFENHLKSNEYGGTSIVSQANEFNKLKYLNALEMHVRNAEHLSFDDQFVTKLDKFRICVKDGKLKYSVSLEDKSFSRLLEIIEIDLGEFLEKKSLKVLLKKADWLRLKKSINFGDLVSELDNEGFMDLRYLEIEDCRDVNFIVNSYGKMNDLLVLPRLESIKLNNLPKLKAVCDGEAPSEIFPNLEHLSVKYSNDLQYVLPFPRVPRKLKEIEVYSCKFLNFIFMENATDDDRRPDVNEQTNDIQLPFVKSLKLRDMDHLIGLLGSQNSDSIWDGLQQYQVFFNHRIRFSSLETFELVNCRRIVKLWDNALGISGFKNLRKISIDRCEGLSSVGPLSVFSGLVQLTSLSIQRCELMREVITNEGTEEPEIHDQVITFTQLKDLIIGESSNLESFYRGGYKLKFPKLKTLQLSNLVSMDKFAGSETSSSLFHDEIDFPCIEELAVNHVKDEVMGLWNWDSEGENTAILTRVPMLRKLTLGKTVGLRLIPSIIYANLSCLKFKKFNDEVLFSIGKEGSAWSYTELPRLEELCVEDCNSLKEFIGKEDFNVAAALTFCRQLKSLELKKLPRLEFLPWHLFKGLCSLHLHELSWEYVFSADALVRVQGSLQQLEGLMISDCGNMRVIIQDDVVGDDLVIEFPRLKKISLSDSSVISFSSTINATLRLPSLEILSITNCKVMKQLWSGQIIAPKLLSVGLHGCDTMQWLLVENPNHTVDLQSLEFVCLSSCPALLSFSFGPLTLPKLWVVELEDCPRMQWFMPHNPSLDDVLELLSLSRVCIRNCPNIQSFSIGSLRTPNLYHVECEEDTYTMVELEINLNHLLRSRQDTNFREELNVLFGETD